MPHQLNKRALEALKAMVRAGKYTDKPWTFSASDGNAILGDPPNWTEYGKWFLGVDETVDKETKGHYAYPYGKNGVVYLSALRAISSRAAQQGDSQIGDEASQQLEAAKQKQTDKAQASGTSDIRASSQSAAAAECLEECREAIEAANRCIRTFANDATMAACVKACADCVSACNVLIQSGGGGLYYAGSTALPSADLLKACITACDRCVDECGAHHNDACDSCAAACRVCSAACKLAIDAAPAAKEEEEPASAKSRRMHIAAMADPKDPNSLTFTSSATIRASDAGDDSPPTFSMTAYTGGPMKLRGWKYPVVVDGQGVSGLDKDRPVLRDHDQGKVVGHAPAGSIEISPEGQIEASGIISGHGAHADEVVNSGLKGFPWQSSIGAKVIKTEFVPAGRSAHANGRSFDGPVIIARRASLGEISFVALGADDNTSARIAASAAEGSIMKFEQWLEAMGFKLADLSDQQKSKLQAKFDAEQLAIQAAADQEKEGDEPDDEEPDDDEDDEEDEKKAKTSYAKAKKSFAAAKEKGDEEAMKAARAKMAECKKMMAGSEELDLTASGDVDLKAFRAKAAKEIRAAHASESKRIGKIREICAGRHANIEAKAIEEGWDETKTELAVLRAERPQGGDSVNAAGNYSFGINTGAGEEATTQIVAAACALSAGISEKTALAGLTEQQKNVVANRKMRNQVSSIYGLCNVIAASHGKRLPSSRMDEDVLRAMFRMDRDLDLQAAGGTGSSATMSLSGITENLLNKSMLDSYATVGSLVDEIAYQTDTNDFKQYKRYRMTASGLMSALGAAGELKSISLQDESYPNQVKTQGVILTIGRDILINDDMGALTQAPTLLGRGAALYREMMVFSNLLVGTSTVAPGASVGQAANSFNFFSTGASNYLSGAGTALGITSLTTAVQKFREQVDANNMPIMLQPDRLLLPPSLEVTGKNLFNGAELVVTALGSTSSKSTDPNINAHKGAYKPLVSPFLSAGVGAKLAKFSKSDSNFANFSNASDTAWMLLANPAGGMAVVQIGYLRGQRTPVIERGEANFNTLGIAMRLFWDFGVALHDYRCGVFSAGA